MVRNHDIDNLRGLAMLGMMVLHACSYFLYNKTVWLVWNYLEWSVPVFLFCSFYITFGNNKKIDFKKRLKRLYVPYLVFLSVYFFLVFFFEKNRFNLPNILASLFLYGGMDFNWLVLLFIYFTLLVPVVRWLEKYKFLFYGFFSLSLISSIVLIFFSPLNYRLDMWLPWTVYIYFTYFFVKKENDKKFIGAIALVSILAFGGLYLLELKTNHNLSQYSNKYPPTLYHISFGIFSTIILYWLSKMKIFHVFNFHKILHFFSINSYSLFFIHILLIFLLTWTKAVKSMNVFSFFGVILGASVLLQIVLNNLQKLFRAHLPVKTLTD